MTKTLANSIDFTGSMPDASKTRLYSRVAESTKANYLAFQDRSKHAHIQSVVAKQIESSHNDEPVAFQDSADDGSYV